MNEAQTNPKFTEREQTMEQRQHIVDQALAMSRSQGRDPSEEAKEQYTRYVQGELTLEEVVEEIMQGKLLRTAGGFAGIGS